MLYALGHRTTPRFDPLLAFLGQKRPHDLINEARRHEFPNADIGRRAALAFAEISAEEQIPNHHVLAVIPVRLAQILAWCQTPEMKYLILYFFSEMSRFFTRTLPGLLSDSSIVETVSSIFRSFKAKIPENVEHRRRRFKRITLLNPGRLALN